MRASIVTSMYNKNKPIFYILDKMFFPSLLQNTSKDIELIILDDCSPAKEQTSQLMKKWAPQFKSKFGSFRFIQNKKNLGFAKSFNKGLKLAKGNVLLILNDDIYLPKNSVKRMVQAQEDNPKFGLLGPVTNEKGAATHQYTKYAPKIKSYTPKNFNKVEKFTSLLKKIMPKEILKVNLLAGFCFIVKKDILQEMGWFNELYKHGYYEDTELSDKIKLKYPIGIIQNIFVSHGGINGCSNSFKQTPLKSLKSILINYFIYIFGGKNKIMSFTTILNSNYLYLSGNTIINKKIKKILR